MKKVLSAITILGLSIGLLGCGKNFSLSANTFEDEQIQFPEVHKCSFVSLTEDYDEEEQALQCRG